MQIVRCLSKTWDDLLNWWSTIVVPMNKCGVNYLIVIVFPKLLAVTSYHPVNIFSHLNENWWQNVKTFLHCIRWSVHHIFCFVWSNCKVVFAAQRQVGETALNDKSSRSHRIIRLVYMMNLYFFKCFMKGWLLYSALWRPYY